MKTIEQYADEVMQRCDELGCISQSSTYLDRRYLSREHMQANEQVSVWMQQAGMQTWQDAVGNVWGRYQSAAPDAKRLVLGSHLDTVINGGKYDGMLGVIAPIALIDMFTAQQIELPFHVDIVGFCDEEGTRFGTTLLGSRALTGHWQSQWASLCDENEISLRQAMLDVGLDFDRVLTSKLDPDSLVGYLELHIEQGPVLEEHNLPTGIVSGIAGAKRMQLTVKGMAGHAGTVPMNMRQDALVGASTMIIAIEKIAQQAGIVATVGTIENRPNAVNVISGQTTFSLDIRSDDDALRDATLAQIIQTCEQLAETHQLQLSYTLTHDAPAVLCHPPFIHALKTATKQAGITPLTLLSGAGHDAMAMADICPIAMLFTRCDKGISHHPAEAINSSDVAASLRVLDHFIQHFSTTLAQATQEER